MFAKKPVCALGAKAAPMAAGQRAQPAGGRRERSADAERLYSAKWVFGFILLHMVGAVILKDGGGSHHYLTGVHALATMVVGVRLCAKRKNAAQVAQWIAYVAGAEVMWRMCKAPIPWETAKYAISLACVVSMSNDKQARSFFLPALFFGLLIPGAILGFLIMPLELARQEVSFYMSGPLCLAMCASWFSRVRFTPAQFQRMGVAFIAPIAGVAAIAIFRLSTMDADFTLNSNFAASGGYGPNQVSSVFSLGALFGLFLHLGERKSKLLRLAFALTVLWFLGQSAITFSRTGIYLFGASFGVSMIFLIQQKGATGRFILAVSVMAGAVCLLLPILDGFTEGKLLERFHDQGLTGRDNIAKLDLQIFMEHPIFGVGTGVSVLYREELGDEHAAHTEYTRLLADHGIFGAVALIVLFAMTAQAFLQAPRPWAKAIVCSLAVWALMFMTVTAMRLAAPAFLLGLIHARFLERSESPLLRVRSGSRPKRGYFTGPAVVGRIEPIQAKAG